MTAVLSFRSTHGNRRGILDSYVVRIESYIQVEARQYKQSMHNEDYLKYSNSVLQDIRYVKINDAFQLIH